MISLSTVLWISPRSCISKFAREIQLHLSTFQSSHGLEYWTPKFHSCLHLPSMWRKHQMLLACFCQERKHRMVKRIVNQVNNPARSFEKSVMQDTTLRQFEMMDDEVSIPREWPCLLEAQPASSKISDMISMALQLPANVDVKSSRRGITGGSSEVAVGDVVVFLEARVDRKHVGSVKWLCQIEDTCMACLDVWEHVAKSLYRVVDNCQLVPLACVTDTCMYSMKEGGALVIW